MPIITRGYRRTDGPTDQPTDRPTDIAIYRAAIAAKKQKKNRKIKVTNSKWVGVGWIK